MIALDNGDAIRGYADTAVKVDYTLHGVVGTAVTQLADGQLGDSEEDLYLSAADGIAVMAILLVNADTSARTVNLYLKPSGGTSRRIIPKDVLLPAGYSLPPVGRSRSPLLPERGQPQLLMVLMKVPMSPAGLMR